MNKMQSPKEGQALKFWSASAQFMTRGKGHGKAWDKFHIAAYTLKDAMQLYIDAGGNGNGIHNYFANYVYKTWGTSAQKFLPKNPDRGVYFTDEHYKSVMFVAPVKPPILDEISDDVKATAAAQKIPKDYGTLRSTITRSKGVKIIEWPFESPFADRAIADRMIATIRIRESKEKRRGQKYEYKLEFAATSDCFEKIVHSDIETLYDMVQEAFRTYEIAQRGVVWEDWLEIEVHDDSADSNRESASLRVIYRKLKRGIDPRNGRVMTINNSHVVMDFPKPRAAGAKPKRDDDGWSHGDNHQVAYLPATRENIAALDSIIAAITTARHRLESMLVQDAITNTLANIPSIPLLEIKK